MPSLWAETPRILWLAVPVMLAAAAHIAVIRLRLLASLAVPIDAGATLRGRRALGDHKTVRGALVMILVSGAGMGLQGFLRAPALEYFDYGVVPLIAVGMWLGCGFVLAELPNSFLKRQAGIPPGGRGPLLFVVLDQLDSVIGCLVALSMVWAPPLRVWVMALLLCSLVHIAFNGLFVAVGLKRSVF